MEQLRELLKKGHKVKALIRQSSVLDNLKNLDVETVELKVSSESKYLRKKYSLDKIPKELCVAVIIREDEIIIPNSYSEIIMDDELLIITKEEYIPIAEKLFQ